MKTKILVVEDDAHIRLGLEELLRGEGYETAVCERGDAAIEQAKHFKPALLVLDVMLPGLSGYDVCRQLRAAGFKAPILMLTAKGQEIDKVLGLELGADDYVTKPFGVRELLARVQALLRRGQFETVPDQGSFRIGSSVINPVTFELSRGEHIETLTAREVKLLQFFAQHPGEVLSRDRLLNEVWGYNYYGTTRTLDQVIVQLRKKLGETGTPRHLVTIHGVGYRLNR